MYKATYAPISVRAFSTFDKGKCRLLLGPNFNSESLFSSANSAIDIQLNVTTQADQTYF